MPTESLSLRSWSTTEPFTWRRASLVILIVTALSAILVLWVSQDWRPAVRVGMEVAGLLFLPCIAAVQERKAIWRGHIVISYALSYATMLLVRAYFADDLFVLIEALGSIALFATAVGVVGSTAFLLLALSSPRTAKILFWAALSAGIAVLGGVLLVLVS